MRHPLVPALVVVLLLAAYAIAGVAIASGAAPGDRVTDQGVHTGTEGAPAGAVAARSPAPSGVDARTPTVSGVVTGENGTPVASGYVLIEPAGGQLLAETTDGDRAVAESLLKLAGTDPDGVTVVRTDAAGRYEATVSADELRAVAVTPEGRRLSAMRSVRAGATANLTVDRHQVVAVRGRTADPVEPGVAVTVELWLSLANDDEPVRNLSVELGPLPGA